MAFMKQWWRVGGVCGLLFIVFFVVGAVLSGEEPPDYTDSAEEIRAYWVDEGNTYLTGDYFIGLGFMLFFFPFVSALSSLLGAAEGGARMWSRVVFAGGILFLAMAAAEGIFWTTLAFGDVAENASDDTLTLLMTLDVGASHFVPVGLAIMTLSTALVIFQTRVLPIWLGVLTLIEGVLATLSPLSILAEDPNESILFIAFPGGAIWLLVTSIVLITKKEAPVAAAAA